VRRLPYGSSPSINGFMTALVAAFSLQDKIEQYGGYAGIAAVFGLGILSLLYFAQAREVKRLRDWAGRAPERAAELEARVQADAQRRAAAAQAPRPTAPVTPAAQQAAPAAGVAAPATAAAAAGATAAATATKPATATPQNGTGSGAAVPVPGTGAKPEGPEPKPAEGDGAKDGEGNGKKEGPEAKPEGPEAKPEGPEAKPAVPGAPATAAGAAPAAPAAKPDAPGQPEVKPPVPPVPAAATAAAAGAVPRPQPAAPLRAPTPSASLPPRTPAGARTAGAGDGRSRGRLAAIVGGALGAVAVVVVAALLLFGGGGGDNKPPTPNTVAQPGATTPAGTKAPAKAAGKVNRKSFPLAVLNGTTVTGLARSAADKLTAKGYNEPIVVTNDTTNQARDTTEIYFEAKARAAALDVAKILGVKAINVKPMDANARALADRATVAVFVGGDKAQ
jgi:hypothetical protein